jgi:DNA polymerase I-like protein with 3'-5' exonuclease and polymerase domains
VNRPVCARYEVLVETGRSSCSGGEKEQQATNFQNPPRKGDVRPCFMARPGFVLCSTDADTIELRAHAQNCLDLPGLGWSRLAEIFIEQKKNGGPDPHETLAAEILRRPAAEIQAGVRANDKECEDARQFAKIPNYGFPGGLGAETFVSYAAGQMGRETFLRWFGRERDEQITFAKGIRETWFETLPENRIYFQLVGQMMDEETREGTIRQLMSGRIRGRVRFTAAANGFFQGRVADAIKGEALFLLQQEAYEGLCSEQHRHGGDLCTLSGRSIYFGARPIMFLHDEPIAELPEDGREHLRAEKQRRVVVGTLERWMPDVPQGSSAVLTRRWYKGAKGLLVDGKLVPVKPEKVDGKVRWVQDYGMAA